MRRPRFGLAIAMGVFLLIPATRAQAQVAGGVGSDVFSFYYGYYLPHQAAIAAQPTPLDTINSATVARQSTAVTNRAGLFDPTSPYGEEEADPFGPYGGQRGRGRGTMATPPSFTSNARGTGPPLFYNRVAQYYTRSPVGTNLRTGRGPNRNIATLRGSRSSMGMGGGGMGMSSMPGPR